MTSSSRYFFTLQLVCCALLLCAAIFVSRTDAQQQPEQFPDGPGKNTFLQTCSSCHSPDNVFGKARNADAWSATLNTMIGYGATGSNDDFAAILKYLAANFGPAPDKINVNKVTAINLRNWLNFTENQADDFIAYRTQHGDFKSLDDLNKVPGIDPKILDAKKDVLTF